MPDQTQQPLTREELLAIIEKAAREVLEGFGLPSYRFTIQELGKGEGSNV